MDDPQRILVIFLSATLAIFLCLGIFLLVKVIKIVKKAENIADRVEHIAEKAETASDFVAQNASKIALGSLIGKFMSKKSSKRRKDADNG
jgi:hypothetical protein